MGRNSYRNLVSCCLECNAKKGQSPAEDLLRWLYRERRLTPLELSAPSPPASSRLLCPA